MLNREDITLLTELEESALISGDPEQLRQVITNLLINAAQAIGEGGTIRISLQMSEVAVELCVEDDGPGIPDEHRERVIEPFFTTKAPGKGTGLGLSVVSGIISEHSGHLKIGKAALGGARFSVFFPLEPSCSG